MAPLSRRALLGAFSGSRSAFAGIFQITQCTQVPAGASGSSMMRANEAAFEGWSLQVRAGEMSVAWQVNCLGMAAPEANAGLARVKAMAEGPPFGGLGCCARRVAASSRSVRLTVRIRPL